MDEVQLKLDEHGKGAFFIETNDNRAGEMVVSIDDKNITVYHTEVSDSLKGTGAGSKLLKSMVAYARTHGLKVIALCPFVSAQFKRHQDEYSDIWNQHWH